MPESRRRAMGMRSSKAEPTPAATTDAYSFAGEMSLPSSLAFLIDCDCSPAPPAADASVDAPNASLAPAPRTLAPSPGVKYEASVPVNRPAFAPAES